MKTSMSIIVCFVVFLSISAISLANQSPLEACIRKNIARSLSPPSNKSETSNFQVEFCREMTESIIYFLKLNGKFPTFYVKAMCRILGSDEKKVKAYITSIWLNRLKNLLNSLTCVKRTTSVIKKNPVETCIQRNINQSLISPSPLNNLITSHYDVMADRLCRDETRVITYFLKMNRKFPTYYVEALCNVLKGNEKEVKEYVIKKWLNHPKEFIDSLACASP